MLNPYQDCNFGVYGPHFLSYPNHLHAHTYIIHHPSSSHISNDWYQWNPTETSDFESFRQYIYILYIFDKVERLWCQLNILYYAHFKLIYHDLSTSTNQRFVEINGYSPPWEVLLVGGFGGEPFNSGSPSSLIDTWHRKMDGRMCDICAWVHVTSCYIFILSSQLRCEIRCLFKKSTVYNTYCMILYSHTIRITVLAATGQVRSFELKSRTWMIWPILPERVDMCECFRDFGGQKRTFGNQDFLDSKLSWLVVWNIFFPYIGNSNPNWLIFFRGVETTNQSVICRHRDGSLHLEQTWNRPFILGYQTEDPAVRPNPRNDIWCGNKASRRFPNGNDWDAEFKFRSQAMEGSLGNIFEQVCCLTKSVVRIKRKTGMASISIRLHEFHIFSIHQFHAICIHWIGLRWFQGKSARTFG